MEGSQPSDLHSEEPQQQSLPRLTVRIRLPKAFAAAQRLRKLQAIERSALACSAVRGQSVQALRGPWAQVIWGIR